MKSLKTHTWLFILITVYLSSCSFSVPVSTPKLTVTTPPPTSITEVLKSTPTLTVTPDTDPTSTSIATTSIECPSVVSAGTAPLWTEGSVLFQRDDSGIWAISAEDNAPVLVNEYSWLGLSDDGTSLMRFEQDELGSVEGDLIIHTRLLHLKN